MLKIIDLDDGVLTHPSCSHMRQLFMGLYDGDFVHTEKYDQLPINCLLIILFYAHSPYRTIPLKVKTESSSCHDTVLGI